MAGIRLGWQVRTRYAARCLEVLDGDTLRVEWLCTEADPFWPLTIRLAGIDAAEMKPIPTPAALAARLALVSLALGREVGIVPRRAWPDPYGRMIAEVWSGEQDCGRALLDRGLVTPWRSKLRRLARVALAKGKQGLVEVGYDLAQRTAPPKKGACPSSATLTSKDAPYPGGMYPEVERGGRMSSGSLGLAGNVPK